MSNQRNEYMVFVEIGRMDRWKSEEAFPSVSTDRMGPSYKIEKAPEKSGAYMILGRGTCPSVPKRLIESLKAIKMLFVVAVV